MNDDTKKRGQEEEGMDYTSQSGNQGSKGGQASTQDFGSEVEAETENLETETNVEPGADMGDLE